MTATISYVVTEFAIDEPPCKWEMDLKDARGNVVRISKGQDREHCIIGLKSAGFTLQE